jgi:hypothetical protein
MLGGFLCSENVPFLNDFFIYFQNRVKIRSSCFSAKLHCIA